MSKGLIERTSLQNIANAIRAKLNVNTLYRPSEMATAIATISGKEVITWHQDSNNVRSFLSEVDYSGTDYTTTEINNYLPATPAPGRTYKTAQHNRR